MHQISFPRGYNTLRCTAYGNHAVVQGYVLNAEGILQHIYGKREGNGNICLLKSPCIVVNSFKIIRVASRVVPMRK